MELKIKTPIEDSIIQDLTIGDVVYLSGTIYTARDSAHLRIIEEGSPVDLEGAVIFHAGPIVKTMNDADNESQDHEMVAVGPTTSTRMNPYEPEVIRLGLSAIIGKGGMDENTSKALVDHNAVYLSAVGGCAALYSKSIVRVKKVHWIDLGVPEAIWELEVKDFGPLIVSMDAHGENLYEKVGNKSASRIC
ncbi:MAG: FumA C-terminus/TtdB family hydratase beta subunit [Methanobacteriaceae archaeon]|nr:FumA C-terminus/TtdB family hydratase beta subunit [Methanobacteriaceae archaeon]